MWNDKLFMTREQIREYDRIAIEKVGIPGVVLMENAGLAAAGLAARMTDKSGTISVLCGPGNNGGDGYVIARHLINNGFKVDTYLAVPRTKVTGDALVNLKIIEAMNAPIVDVTESDGTKKLTTRLRHSSLIVDALLGTGVSRNVEGHLAELINTINDTKVPVMAVDIPSGLDADSGQICGTSVRATATGTFGHLKRGLVLFPGTELAGKIHVFPIGVPAFVSQEAGTDGSIVSVERVCNLLPKRRDDTHKGSYGHLLVVAGSRGMTGAPAMAGQAAMRIGTGLVTLATTAQAQPTLEAKCLETMVDHIIERADAPLNEKTNKRLTHLLENKQAIAVGPGLTTKPGISALLMRFLKMAEVPVVIDADGINILANDPSSAGRIEAPMIMTPHPGEMSRLLKMEIPQIQANRIGAARKAAKQYNSIILLKGAQSVIAEPDGQVFINPTGNPGMASAGMGDVLTGIIGGLLAQGLKPLDAALLGAYLHGFAGDRAADRVGMPGLIASDVIAEIPEILKDWSV